METGKERSPGNALDNGVPRGGSYIGSGVGRASASAIGGGGGGDGDGFEKEPVTGNKF